MTSTVAGALSAHQITAAGTAVAAGGAAKGAYSYNRANYMMDAGLRFSRYTSGYSFAIAQASQYREDIRDFTALTVTKQDTYHVLGVIFFVLNFQLIMAGRLGVHGPSPPGWLLALYWGNISSALMYLCIYNWLSMHASARATSGGVHMLTRSVRLPIPTPKQLDKARKTGNTYERQRVNDMFRVPFVAPAPKDSATLVESDASGSFSSDGGKKGSKSPAPAQKRRIPRWHHDEKASLHAANGAKPNVPDHFELYRGLQQEWWCHDVYARVGMMVFIDHWLTAAALYSQCHCFGELRQMWPAWTVTFMFVCANFCVLYVDVVGTSVNRLPKIEYVKPIIPVICVLGMSLDYSIATPTPALKGFIYFLSWICYLIQFSWSLRLLDICWPHQRNVDDVEAPGQPWHSKEFWVPAALQGIVYLVTPPTALEAGAPKCLQQEMKAAKTSMRGASMKAKENPEPQLFPWRVFRGALLTGVSMWVFIMIGRIIEQANGERQLLKQEGRVERWPSHMQPWMPPWSRSGTRNEWAHTGGSDRRLAQSSPIEPRPWGRPTQEPQQEAWSKRVPLFGAKRGLWQQEAEDFAAAGSAKELLATLKPIIEALHEGERPAPGLRRAGLTWPGELRPTMLATSTRTGHLAALAPDSRGALVEMPNAASATPFSLSGLSGLGDVLGASWGDAGLLLTTAGGALVECPGLPESGLWACRALEHRLPLGASGLRAASAARAPATGLLRAALAFAGEEAVALFDLDPKGEWLPAGEVQLPEAAGAGHFSLSAAADELLLGGGDGRVIGWPLTEQDAPGPVMVAAPEKASIDSRRVWHATCSCGGNRVARLASTLASGGRQELLISTRP